VLGIEDFRADGRLERCIDEVHRLRRLPDKPESVSFLA
jgi:hypothetical protein